MKIRILNGGHATIAYAGGLLDIEYVHEAMAHPMILGFLNKLEITEIIPTIAPVPNTDLTAYYAKIVERFSNPEVADTERRLCLDGSNRQPKFIVPPLRDALAQGQKAEGLALVSALWCRYCAGVSDNGRPIAPNDPNWEALQACAIAAQSSPQAWLEQRMIYGDLADHPTFPATFAAQLALLRDKGCEAALRAYIG